VCTEVSALHCAVAYILPTAACDFIADRNKHTCSTSVRYWNGKGKHGCSVFGDAESCFVVEETIKERDERFRRKGTKGSKKTNGITEAEGREEAEGSKATEGRNETEGGRERERERQRERQTDGRKET
jgi:3-oxoacyl-[acyl-carrier-protein] synthase III